MTHEPSLGPLKRCMADLRESLAAGRIESIDSLATRLEGEVAAMDLGSLTRQGAERLRDDATSLEILLRASSQGVRSARQRVDDLLGASRGLGTYDREGHALHIPSVSGRALRRL